MKIHPNLNVRYHYRQPTPSKHKSLTQNDFANRLEYMKYKYKNVFKSVVPYSAELAKNAQKMIQEKYPFHISPAEKSASNTAKGASIVEEKMKTLQNLDEKTKQEYKVYIQKIAQSMPVQQVGLGFETDEASVNYYNAAVFEGLEYGYDLANAKRLAREGVAKYIQSSYHNVANPHVAKYGLESGFEIQKDDIYMAKHILLEIGAYNFLKQYPKINEEIARKELGENPPEELVKQRASELKFQQSKALVLAQIAYEVFSKYEIHNKNVDLRI